MCRIRICRTKKLAKFASQHLFNYTGSTTDFSSKNDLGNYLLYKVPGSPMPVI